MSFDEYRGVRDFNLLSIELPFFRLINIIPYVAAICEQWNILNFFNLYAY